jgi:hypothetical protein
VKRSDMARALRRFWSKADVRAPGECWPWMATRDRCGYGRFSLDGRPISAHRFALGCFRVLTPGLVVDHLCGNPACVNPAHLEQVTQRENVHRGDSPGARAVRTGRCHRGHVLAGENLIARRDGTRDCKACRREAQRARRAARRAVVA